MSEPRQLEIRVAANGRYSKVLLDGQDVPGCYRVLVDTSVDDFTKVEIYARHRAGDPYVIKGYMVEDPNQPSLVDEDES